MLTSVTLRNVQQTKKQPESTNSVESWTSAIHGTSLTTLSPRTVSFLIFLLLTLFFTETSPLFIHIRNPMGTPKRFLFNRVFCYLTLKTLNSILHHKSYAVKPHRTHIFLHRSWTTNTSYFFLLKTWRQDLALTITRSGYLQNQEVAPNRSYHTNRSVAVTCGRTLQVDSYNKCV